MNRSLGITAVIISLLSGACHRAGPVTTSSTIEPSTGTSNEPLKTRYRTSWTISPTTEIQRYVVTQGASTRMIEAPVSSSDSLMLTARFSLTLSRQNSLTRFSATIDRLSAQRSSQTNQLNPELPVTISGRIDSSSLTVDSPSRSAPISTSGCTTGILTILMPIKSAALITPLHLTTGMSWTDSISLPGCAGSITTTTRRRSSYRVIGDTIIDRLNAILLDLTEMSSTEGDGSEGQHSIQITASGSGVGRVVIDAAGGQVLRSNIVRTTELSVRASGRVHRFRQVLNEETLREDRF